jgi:hypothetical protein
LSSRTLQRAPDGAEHLIGYLPLVLAQSLRQGVTSSRSLHLSPLIDEKYAECNVVDELWPALPYDAWKDTYATLHMWSQIVGKVVLALAPPINHSWGIALHLTSRGLLYIQKPRYATGRSRSCST